MTYLINVIADYRLSSIHQAFPFLSRVCFASKIFLPPVTPMLIFDIFFLHAFNLVFAIGMSHLNREKICARELQRLFLSFFSFAYRPIMNRLTKKLMKIQNDQSLGILLKSFTSYLYNERRDHRRRFSSFDHQVREI